MPCQAYRTGYSKQIKHADLDFGNGPGGHPDDYEHEYDRNNNGKDRTMTRRKSVYRLQDSMATVARQKPDAPLAEVYVDNTAYPDFASTVEAVKYFKAEKLEGPCRVVAVKCILRGKKTESFKVVVE